jgi:dephospho-CoA kinase
MPRFPLRIGLTGGIGSGKSTVAGIFERFGVPVIDTDAIAHELVKPGQPALKRLVAEFGESILDARGALNRRQLAKRIFQNPEERHRLVGILHPLIREEVGRRLEALDAPYCLIAVPLLIEARFTDLVDRVLVIDADESEQIRRIRLRSNLPEDEIRNILAAQADRRTRLDAADDVIRNDRDIGYLETEVARLHSKYLSLALERT